VGKRKRALKSATTWLNLSVIGIQFPVAMAIGYFWGKWMDGWFGTWPYLTGLFSLLGIIAGFVNLFRMTAEAARSEENQLRPELGLKVYPPEDEVDGEDAIENEEDEDSYGNTAR
jgi:ATP synthase protein I